MKKHIAVISLTLTAILLSSSLVFAATPQEAADQLNAKGLFQGTSKGYELDRQMTRAEAITMFVKIIGKNDEAKNGTWTAPFTDVEDWAKPYVGYAYTNKLSSGVSATKFGSNEPVSYTQYLTFVLKALNYEVGKDFQWDKAYELSNEIGLTKGVGGSSQFLRGDAAVVSLGTVEKMGGGDKATNSNSDQPPTVPIETPNDKNKPQNGSVSYEEFISHFDVKVDSFSSRLLITCYYKDSNDTNYLSNYIKSINTEDLNYIASQIINDYSNGYSIDSSKFANAASIYFCVVPSEGKWIVVSTVDCYKGSKFEIDFDIYDPFENTKQK